MSANKRDSNEISEMREREQDNTAIIYASIWTCTQASVATKSTAVVFVATQLSLSSALPADAHLSDLSQSHHFASSFIAVINKPTQAVASTRYYYGIILLSKLWDLPRWDDDLGMRCSFPTPWFTSACISVTT